jgi:prolyl 3-hydroxylase /prolyl 3,4-dihydroxylase
LNPSYLKTDNLQTISDSFVETSQITLQDFLNEPLASKLRTGCREQDENDGYCQQEINHIPSHASGHGESWKVIGPPHKFRYCVLNERAEGSPSQDGADASYIATLRSLQEKLFPSDAFRAWLAFISRLCPRRYSVAARRFRPGLDYTLATSNDKEARLDVALDLTPGDILCKGKGREGAYGGWEVCSYL